MKVTCHGCRRTLNIPDRLVGQTIACPACKAAVKVEETLGLMPEADSAPPPRPAGGGLGPAAGEPGISCPACGMPLMPNDMVCKHCGTNAITGRRGRHGYQAGVFRKIGGRLSWVLTLVVGAGIAAGIWYGVKVARRKASVYWESEEESEEAPPGGPGPAGPKKPAPASGSPATGSQPVDAGGDEAAAQADAPAEGESGPSGAELLMDGRVEHALALLLDPLPEMRKKGLVRLTSLGPPAIPRIAKRLSEAEEPRVRAELVKALGLFRTEEVIEPLVKALSDVDPRVRSAAVEGLIGQGKVISDLIGPLLESKDAPARAAAVRVVSALSLNKYAGKVLALLGDDDKEVRYAAARSLRGRMATEGAAEALVEALDDSNLDVAAAASASLAVHPGALPLVMEELEAAGKGDREERANTLFFLAGPILASRDPDAAEKLARVLCAETPIPKLIQRVKNILSAPRVSARLGLMTAERRDGETKPPMPLVMSLCMADPDTRIRAAAREYLAANPAAALPMPFVIALGDQQLRSAMSAADELTRMKGQAVVAALRKAVAGVDPQRRLLAAGVLARRKDEAGAEILLAAARGDTPFPTPLPGWAAYQHSRLGIKGAADRYLLSAGSARTVVEKAYYNAAAARLGYEGALESLRPMLGDRRIPGDARVEIARLMGELGAEGATDILFRMMGEPSVNMQIAAIKALADTGDADVVTAILDRMRGLVPAAEEAARNTILSFGRAAETRCVEALSGERPVRLAALTCLARVGQDAALETKKAVLMVMRIDKNDGTIRAHASKALEAMTGMKGKPDWTWREWTQAMGMRLPDPSTLPMDVVEWGWLSMAVPKEWLRGSASANDPTGPGSPGLEVKRQTYELTPQHGYRMPPIYTSADDMRKKTKINMGLGRAVPGRGKIAVVDGALFAAGRDRAAPMKIVDAGKGITTYWVFVMKEKNDVHYYASVAMSVKTKHYGEYSKLFEGKMARSVRLLAGKRVVATAKAGPPEPQSWQWLTLVVPSGWKRMGNTVSDAGSPALPRITVRTERDPTGVGEELPSTKRRYRAAKNMLLDRMKQIAYRKIGDQYIPLPSIQAKPGRTSYVKAGTKRGQCASLLVVNQENRRTTYYIFMVVADRAANWYAEIECSALTTHYASYKDLFEKAIPKSLTLEPDLMK